jgi:zinc-binding alcohol dehydrogenase family protein
LTGLTVLATASRPESIEWCLGLGAHHVVDHSKPMKEQIEKLKVPPVGLIASLTATDKHFPALVDILAPQGAIGLIDDPASLDALPLKGKAASLHWELMFTRSTFQTEDMIKQHELLDQVAALIDKGELKTTLDRVFGKIDAANLKRAHAVVESGRSTGKIVLEGW